MLPKEEIPHYGKDRQTSLLVVIKKRKEEMTREKNKGFTANGSEKEGKVADRNKRT